MDKQTILKSTIESVYKRMGAFGQPGRQCEMQVRYSLVDPILRAIGWNLENPDCVQVDSAEDNTRRDYTLFVKGSPVAAIETKYYGCFSNDANKQNPYKFPEYDQVIEYCKGKGIRIAILTDGGFWAIFSLHPNLKIKSTYKLDYDNTKNGLTKKQNIKRMIKVFSLLTPRKIARLP